MQSSTIEKVRPRRLKDPNINSKVDKKTRRNRRLFRAIKSGEYIESNTLDNKEN